MLVVLRKDSALLLWYSRSGIIQRSGQELSKVLSAVSQRRHLLKMVWISFLLTAKEPRGCLLILFLVGAAVPQCSAETPEQAGSSVCNTRFYTSSDPKPAARASPQLCPPAKNEHLEEGYKNSSLGKVYFLCIWLCVLKYSGVVRRGWLCSTWPMELTGRSSPKISGSMCMTCVLCFLWAQAKFSIFTDGHWTLIHLGLWGEEWDGGCFPGLFAV